MTLTDAFIRFDLGASASPAPSTDVTSGAVRIGRAGLVTFPAATAVYGGRIIFSVTSQTAAIMPGTGAITVSATGTRQVAKISAAGACTTSGTLVVTITSAASGAFPLALSVPINTTQHTTAALVADAIRTVMADTAALTAVFTVSGTGAQIVLTRIAGYANDGTLAISWPSALTAGPTGAAATAGAVGVVIDRPGGDAKDIFGNALGTLTAVNTVALFAPANTLASSVACSSVFSAITPGNVAIFGGPTTVAPGTAITLTAAGLGIVDFLVMGS